MGPGFESKLKEHFKNKTQSMWVYIKIFSGDAGQLSQIYQCIPLNIAKGHLVIGHKKRLKITPLLNPFHSLSKQFGDMFVDLVVCCVRLFLGSREPTISTHQDRTPTIDQDPVNKDQLQTKGTSQQRSSIDHRNQSTKANHRPKEPVYKDQLSKR